MCSENDPKEHTQEFLGERRYDDVEHQATGAGASEEHSVPTTRHEHDQSSDGGNVHLLDDKSIVRRAYDLIDRTAERIRLPPPRYQATTSEHVLDLSPVEFPSLESDMELAPVVARAKAKAASAYFTGGGKRREQVEPGAEYVRSRAPGLDSSFYLRLMRIHNFRRAGNAQQQLADHAETAEASRETAEASSVQAGLAVKTSNDKTRKRSLRLCLYCAAVTICVLAAGAVAIALVTKEGGTIRSSNLQNASKDPTRFSPFTMDCDTMKRQPQPNVWLQCNCTRNISIVAADIRERYDNLTSTFIRTVFTDYNESFHSCSPQNQALVWLASGDGTTNPTRMRQRYTFALLFSLWDGPGWTSMEKWLTPADECNWYGLECNDRGEVVNVSLATNELLIDLPPIASLLGQLQSLVVYYNSIRGSTIPTEVGLLSNLVDLELGSTGLSGKLPTELFTIGTLQHLGLAQNRLSGSISTLIGKLTNLESLDLDGMMSFTGTIPAEVGLCTNLEELSLGGNNLIGTLPSALGALTALSALSLGRNSLTGTIPSGLGRCVLLSWIYMSSNYLSGTVPAEFANLPFLVKLDILGNHLQVPLAVCQHFEPNLQNCVGCNCS